MKRFLGNQKGFTLVELMIVIVIVGILAAVAIPIYQGNIRKAKMSECDAALGTVRTAMRVFYAEHGRYPRATDGTAVTGTTLGDSLNISAMDLNGKYFSAGNYTVDDVTDTTYTIVCDNAEVLGTENTRRLDHNGNFLDSE